MKFRNWLITFIIFIGITGGLVAGFNALIDPFGLFGDPIMNWYEYNMTNNPRVAKIGYLDRHYEDYNSYIIGCSKTSSFSPDKLDNYIEGAHFYNMLMYGGDMYDIEKTALYVLEHYNVENLFVNIGLEEPTRYQLEADEMKGNLHGKVDDSSILKFYSKYLLTNPQYAFDKISAYYESGYLPNIHQVFNVENGAYDKRVRDIESIVNMDDYLTQNPGFREGLSEMPYQYTEEVLRGIENIKNVCDEKGVNFSLIASPIYFNEVDKCKQADLADYWRRLAEITDFWDFSGYSPISYDVRYFYDPLHFRNAGGDMALAYMSGDESVYVPEGFGHLTTKENVADRAQAIFTKPEKPVDADTYTKEVPILMYHHFNEDEGKSNDATITPQKFREDMEALKAAGYETVFYKDLVAYVEAGRELPEKPVVISIDDGYESNYKYVYPILKELDMKATIAMIGVSVGKDTYKETDQQITPHFDLKEARKMLESGVIDIQAHSFNMHDYGPYEKGDYREGVLQMEDESEEAYIKAFREDYMKIEDIIEDELGQDLYAYIYPLGKNSKLSEVLLAEQGVKVTVTTVEGMNTVVKGLPQSLLGMKRYNVPYTLSPEQLIRRIEEK